MVQKPSTFLVGAFWIVVLGIEVLAQHLVIPSIPVTTNIEGTSKF